LGYDVWHPVGYLLEKFGFRAVYDAGSHIGARVSSIIRNGEWFWPFVHSHSIVTVQSQLHEIDIGETDLLIWILKTGSYSCGETWETLRSKLSIVSWYKAI
jgi:hypothetical protein